MRPDHWLAYPPNRRRSGLAVTTVATLAAVTAGLIAAVPSQPAAVAKPLSSLAVATTTTALTRAVQPTKKHNSNGGDGSSSDTTKSGDNGDSGDSGKKKDTKGNSGKNDGESTGGSGTSGNGVSGNGVSGGQAGAGPRDTTPALPPVAAPSQSPGSAGTSSQVPGGTRPGVLVPVACPSSVGVTGALCYQTSSSSVPAALGDGASVPAGAPASSGSQPVPPSAGAGGCQYSGNTTNAGPIDPSGYRSLGAMIDALIARCLAQQGSTSRSSGSAQRQPLPAVPSLGASSGGQSEPSAPAARPSSGGTASGDSAQDGPAAGGGAVSGAVSGALSKIPTGPTKQLKIWLTGYSYQDNTPPGSAIVSHPILHQKAGGTGTYTDPITVASPGTKDNMAFPAATRFYLPSVARYVIVEDSGASPPPSGTDGHLDMWVDGEGGDKSASDSCMNTITSTSAQAIENPPPGEPVTSGPITANGHCNLPSGGEAR